MSRLHLKFRNVDARVVRALTQTMEAKPWRRHTNEARRRVAQELADRIVDAYRIQYPLVVRTAENDGLNFNPGSDSILWLRRDGWNTLTLLSGIRLFVATATAHDAEDPNAEVDHAAVWAWACSALYIVSPVVFRSLARAGKVDGVTAQDTYTSETWAKIVEAGYADDDGGLTESPEIVANFLVTGERQVDDESPAPSLPSLGDDEVDSLFTAEDDEEGFDPEDDDFEQEGPTEDPEDDYDPSADVDDEDEEDVEPEQAPATTGRFTGGSDGLDDLGIVKLRKLSRGRVSGGYSMRSPELIAALREQGVTASMLDES